MPKYKVGDRVSVEWDLSMVFTISKVDPDEYYCYDFEEGGSWEDSGLILVESSSPTFKVGDKVKCLHPVVVCSDYKDQVGEVLDVNGLESEGCITIDYDGCWQAAYIKEDGVVLVSDYVMDFNDGSKINKFCYKTSPTKTTDSVNHPSHYNESGIECIEAIEATLGPVGFQAYCKGNCMKYLWRYPYKNGLEDLKKAQVYLNWMIESMEKSDD